MTSAGIMPRILVLWATLAGCGFDASYGGGHFKCSDGQCPSGLTCVADLCVAPVDAGLDATDAAIDARLAALTCADPGLFPAAGGTAQGSTAGVSMISATCGGVVMNGPDTVYRVDTTAGEHVGVTIGGATYPVNAYVISPCTTTPGTPLCVGNVFAAAGTPISVIVGAGPQFVIVDGISPAQSGVYTLTVAVTP
jgi:hypothetical protein